MSNMPDLYVPVFTNINEEGEPYETHDNLEAALETLGDYPNDTIEVKLAYQRDPAVSVTRDIERDERESYITVTEDDAAIANELTETFNLMLDSLLADYNVSIPANLSWQHMTKQIAQYLAARAISDIKGQACLCIESGASQCHPENHSQLY
jgi:hypothetical protein